MKKQKEDNVAHGKQQAKPGKPKALGVIGLGVAAVAILGILVGLGWWWFAHSYAQDEAGSLESALVKAGAVKQCDAGSAGRGPDNYSPWYSAIYTIAEDRQAATNTVRNAAQEAGLSLVDKTDPTPRFDQHYYGIASKKISRFDLKDGDAQFGITVYETRSFVAPNDKKYCTTTSQANPLTSTTTIEIGVGLPTFKGY